MKILILLLISLISFKSKANVEKVYCSHPEICRLIQKASHDSIPTQSLIEIKGDPHEFEPSPSQIKEFLSVKILIQGPKELNPWMRKINTQRAKNKSLITFALTLNQTIAKNISKTNNEAISHFWLYPEIYCDMRKQLTNWSWPLELKEKFIPHFDCQLEKINPFLRDQIKKIKNPIVLTHDALSPLLSYYGLPQNQIINLKGSGHHDEIEPNAVKMLYNALQNKKIIWIIEKDINIPENILVKIRKEDKVVKIDTANSLSQIKDLKKTIPNELENFSILYYLMSEINQ